MFCAASVLAMSSFRYIAAIALPLALVAGPAHAVPVKKRPNAGGVVNVNKYLKPKNGYFGVYTGVQGSGAAASAARFGKTVGRKPTMVKAFANWGDGFDKAWAAGLWKAGMMPQFELEAWPTSANGQITLKKIADGKADAYIKRLAQDVRAAKMPVGLSFAHEFNGDWYPWGYCSRKNNANACKYKNKPQDFVRAWKRMHTLFTKAGATNAIWMWSPNETAPRSEVKLKPFYPGDTYVDWIGAIGYFRGTKARTFNQLFLPTFKQLRTFTKKPIILGETGADYSAARTQNVKNLMAGLAKSKDVIGFVWFNKNQSAHEGRHADYRIQATKAGLSAFKSGLKKTRYGKR